MRILKSSVFISGLVIAVIFTGIIGCEEESFLGKELLPSKDNINVVYTDDFGIKATTYRIDSAGSGRSYFDNPVKPSTTMISKGLVGNYHDPSFGTGSASFMFTLQPQSGFYTYGESPTLDSVVLSLAITDFYGSSDLEIPISVYQLNTRLRFDSIYYSNSDPDDYADMSESWSTLARSSGDTNVISVQLSNEIGNLLISADSSTNRDVLNFSSYFKGFYVAATGNPAPGNGSVLFCDLLNEKSILTVFYNDTLSTEYFVDDIYSPRVNLFDHNYELSKFNDQLSDSTAFDTLLYIQSMGGTGVRLLIEDLDRLKDSLPLMINKAELVVKNYGEDPDLKTFTLPNNLTLRDENNAPILDEYLISGSESSLGGSYDATSGSYTFRVTNFIENILLGDSVSNELKIITQKAVSSASRVIITNGTGENKIKLKVTYTKP